MPPPLQRLLTLLSVTLLAGLVAISTFGDGRGLAIDARAAGLGVVLNPPSAPSTTAPATRSRKASKP